VTAVSLPASSAERSLGNTGLSTSILVYILRTMTERAKLFRNGGSQAVRLPKDCRFPDDQQEVLVHRVGNKVILEPVDAWSSEFLACIGAWQERILRPKGKRGEKPRDPFE
jgi:antitoxin VapB